LRKFHVIVRQQLEDTLLEWNPFPAKLATIYTQSDGNDGEIIIRNKTMRWGTATDHRC
jgi:hypothetical protein